MLPGGIFLALLFLVPLAGLLMLSLGMPNWTLARFVRIGGDPVHLAVLRTTLQISISATALALVLGYPIAYSLTTRKSSSLRTFLLIAVVLPYFTSVLVRTFAWIVLLGRGGIINDLLLKSGIISQPISMLYNRASVIIGMTQIVMPLMILPMYTVMSGIDQKLLRAARANGASPIAAFLTVFLPLSMPGVMAAVLLVFVNCLGFYITPALLGSLSDFTITMQIYSEVVDHLNWASGSALSIVLLVSVLATLWIGSRFFPVNQLLGLPDDKNGRDMVSNPRMQKQWLMHIGSAANILDGWLPSLGGYGISIVSTLLGALLLLPILVVVYLSFSSSAFFEFPAPGYSFHNYQAFISDAGWINATSTSIRVALMATSMAIVLGATLAFGLARGRIPGRGAMVALVLSPIILPTIVVAIATYFLLARVGLQGTEFGLALGEAVYSIPYVVVLIVANLRDLNPAYERAARSLGAGPTATFRTIIIPLITPAFIVAAFFAFLHSFDDVVYVLFLGIGVITTLPMLMWQSISQGIDPTISAVATLQVLLAATVIVVSALLRRRKSV
ncbi:putative spermidine/putrescine transport system permease protein [Bradyrhizobium sp. CIR48]|uniref:ABC transporter permease subunit n=1 Tax=Bradyrhizobium sp. CIR48 TaxID=2663840 RepID=UPI00160645BE|nr:ABC transporter permease subunit [Bradyrhizobium sp. CIR48]MBB4423935.1 putative spermidine/putrescine transport system permease protein [Bradyrhizobium sp. CIR48]